MGENVSYWQLVRGNRNFRLLWLAQIVSEIGDWLYAVVLYDMLLQSTGKASAVATAVVLQVLPQVLVSPLAGVVNDRLSRRTVMIITDIVRFAIIACMLFVIRGGQPLHDLPAAVDRNRHVGLLRTGPQRHAAQPRAR
ncbi:MAG: MFS transporter [Bryobacterales bacterium]|nr:MFS transporter [Bryobacterales bacterium]